MPFQSLLKLDVSHNCFIKDKFAKFMKLYILYIYIYCLLNQMFVFIISDGLLKIQGIVFPFCLFRLYLKTFSCLTVWPPIISWMFLLCLYAIISLVWNNLWNLVFTCRTFQFLLTISDMLESVLLYIHESGILLLLLFSSYVNGSFHSNLSTFFIYSSRTSSLFVCLETSV